MRNFLIHYGLVKGEVEMPTGGQMYLDMPDASCYVQSQHSGVLELLVALGDEVKKAKPSPMCTT